MARAITSVTRGRHKRLIERAGRHAGREKRLVATHEGGQLSRASRGGVTTVSCGGESVSSSEQGVTRGRYKRLVATDEAADRNHERLAVRHKRLMRHGKRLVGHAGRHAESSQASHTTVKASHGPS